MRAVRWVEGAVRNTASDWRPFNMKPVILVVAEGLWAQEAQLRCGKCYLSPSKSFDLAVSRYMQ